MRWTYYHHAWALEADAFQGGWKTANCEVSLFNTTCLELNLVQSSQWMPGFVSLMVENLEEKNKQYIKS